MSEDNIIAIGLTIIGLLCIIVSYKIAHALSQSASNLPLAARVALSGFPLPLCMDLGGYLLAGDGLGFFEWYAAYSIIDHLTFVALILVGLLTAWLVLKQQQQPVDLDVFR